jgi:hypothetical protein
VSRLFIPVFLAALLAGCPIPDDPGPITLFDDDDDGANDDDSALDDDDAGDDDATDDDDAVGPQRSGIVWLLDRHDLVAGGPGDLRGFAAGSFVGEAAEPMIDVEAYLGLPLPGLLLHPDLMPVEMGCTPISSLGDHPDLPESDDVGDPIRLTSAGDDIDVPRAGEAYRVELQGPIDPDLWSLTLDGSGSWPGSTIADALSLPERPTETLPTPGSLGDLTAVHVGWIPGDSDGVEVSLVRYASQANTNDWSGVRCLADDDGTFTINATALAAAGSGDIQVSIARAAWTVLDAEPDLGRPALHAGAIRSVSYRMTVGGR